MNGVDALTDDNTGQWLVRTSGGSTYRFDLDARTVERIGGDARPPAGPADTLQSLRGLIEVGVGRPGRWWMRGVGGYTDPDQVWQSSSVVMSIQPDAGEEAT